MNRLIVVLSLLLVPIGGVVAGAVEPAEPRGSGAPPLVAQAETEEVEAADPVVIDPPGYVPDAKERLREMSFEDLDTDGDGDLTPAEAELIAAMTEDTFKEIDVNRNDIIEEYEFEAYQQIRESPEIKP